MLFRKTKCPNCEAYHDPTLRECPECHKSSELYKLNRVPKRVMFFHPAAQIGLFLIGFAYFGMLILEVGIALFREYLPSEPVLRSSTALVLTYGGMFIALMAIALFTGRRKLFFEKFTNGTDYLYGIGYAATLIGVMMIVNCILSFFYDVGGNSGNQESIEMVTLGYPLLTLPFICIIGPIVEEMTYRVGLYSFLRRFNKYAAIIGSAVVFAFIHFEFSAADLTSEFQSIPAYLVPGFILAIAYEHRGPASSMMAHIIYNSFATLLIFVRYYGQ